MVEPAGTGPGKLTADGCAVDPYRQLPALGEAAIVHAAIRAGVGVLDLGCGTGRIAHPLSELGHPVVGVDQSADMLAHVRVAETVCAPIAGLDLQRSFGGVLLASHLVNTPEATDRRALLETVRRHLAPDGRLVAEWHPPEWFDAVSSGSGGTIGAVRVQLTDVHRGADILDGTVRYWAGDELWTQTFRARRLTQDALCAELAATGLAFDGYLTDDCTWFAALPAR
jgi:SAM-dependent methyltransferase